MVHPDEVASALLREHDDRQRFHSLRESFPFDDIRVSYDIQDRLVEMLKQRNRCGLAGYKIGLTSARMQALCGIPHPIAGAILANRVHASGASISTSDFVHVGVECEIAVRIARDLEGSLPTTIAKMGEVVAAVAPALELVEDRHADYTALDMLTLVADNSWNAGIVLGEFSETWPDLAAIEGVVTSNGQPVDRGFGRDVLGHPFEPLLWLCRHLADRGLALKAGDIVMTGSLVPTRFPAAGDTLRFSLAGLGAVEAAITA